MRDALSLTDQAIAYGSGAVEEAAGAPDARRGRSQPRGPRCIEALAARDGAALIAAVDGLRELGLSAAGTLEEMAALLQEMAVLQAVPGALDGDDPDAPSPRASRRCCRPTRRSCSTASSCTAGPSWRSRPTSTAAW